MIPLSLFNRTLSDMRGGRCQLGRLPACLVMLLLAGSALISCRHVSSGLAPVTGADSAAIVNDNIAHRVTMDAFFRDDPHSPFVRDTTIAYHGLRWFPIDPVYCVHSVLHVYPSFDTVLVMGTKGEERRQLRYGYFEFVLPDDEGAPVTLRLNVYKFTPYDRDRYERYPENLCVWFTDRTSGKDTYGVGRYLDVGDDAHDAAHVYTIDFNKAYNPYCAYSTMYSCAIPRRDDHVDITLRAGETKYHE